MLVAAHIRLGTEEPFDVHAGQRKGQQKRKQGYHGCTILAARERNQKTTRTPACICRFPPPAVLITPNVARFDMFVPGELKLGELVTLSACMFTSRRSRSWIGNDLYRNALSPNAGGERNSARYGGSGEITYWLASGCKALMLKYGFSTWPCASRRSPKRDSTGP